MRVVSIALAFLVVGIAFDFLLQKKYRQWY